MTEFWTSTNLPTNNSIFFLDYRAVNGLMIQNFRCTFIQSRNAFKNFITWIYFLTSKITHPNDICDALTPSYANLNMMFEHHQLQWSPAWFSNAESIIFNETEFAETFQDAQEDLERWEKNETNGGPRWCGRTRLMNSGETDPSRPLGK